MREGENGQTNSYSPASLPSDLHFAQHAACTTGIAPASSAPRDWLLLSVLLLPLCIFRFVHKSVTLKELF